MNRIILIGNGFDLAHGLKTSYQNFLDDYWREWMQPIFSCEECQLSDEFYKFFTKYECEGSQGISLKNLIYPFNTTSSIDRTWGKVGDSNSIKENVFQYVSNLFDAINQYNEGEGFSGKIHHESTSQLFNAINKAYLSNWVDIENEYYRFLKSIHDLDSRHEVTAEMLNADLNKIKDKLVSCLSIIQENTTDNLFIKDIEHKLLSPFDLRDISNDGQKLFLDYLFLIVSQLAQGMSADEIKEEIRKHPEYQLEDTQQGAYRGMIKYMLGKGELDDYIFPDRTLLLNFNYTNTAEKLYSQSADSGECELIHIYGELNNPDNPIIFGYGDEMDEHHKKIVNLNDNDYLQNIKSIRYLETDNYRKLLSFIDSSLYQIYYGTFVW